jgi:hypothetical protein
MLAIVGVYLVIMYAPMPVIIRAIYPFTYFIFYQHAIIARSYILLSLILSLIAIIYQKRRERIYLFATLLILLGSVSVHGFLISLGLIAVEAIKVVKDWGNLERNEKARYLKSVMALCIFFAISVLILWPPSDHSTASGYNFGLIDYLRTNAHLIYDCLSGNRYLSILLFTVLLWWFWYRKKLLVFLATTVPIFTLFAVKWTNPHYAGIFFMVLFFNLWLSFKAYIAGDWRNKPGLIILTAILTIFSFHLYWTVSAFRYDFSEKYSASREVANYLKANHLENQKIAAVGNRTIAILPYFDRNIFANFNAGQKPCYWVWAESYNPNVWSNQDTTANSMHDKAKLAAKDSPDLIIASVLGEYDPSNMPLPGYKLTKFFQGRVHWRDKAGEQESFAIFAREVNNEHTIANVRSQ